MKTRRDVIRIVLFCIGAMVLLAGVLSGEQGRGMRGRGGAGADDHDDMMTIHALFVRHNSIKREVHHLADGVETVTESNDPAVAALIVEHTYAMKARIEKNEPIRRWDPLFAELFANSSKIRMEVTATANGVRVKETSADADVVKLIQAHAETVSRFISKGMPAMHEGNEIP